MTDKIKRLKRKIDRTLNQRHSYDYPPTSGAFVKYKANPVLRREDGGSMFDPFVREVGGELLMCVSNRKNRSLEMYASQDGTEWFLRGELLKATPDTWEDNLNRGCFVIKDGIWYLYYTGQNGDVSKIGLATSEDGVHFVREKSNPIMQPELDFENAAVMNPCVMYDSDQALFRMWYAAGESFEPDVLAYAESKDGVSWTKRPRPRIRTPTSRESVWYIPMTVSADGEAMRQIPFSLPKKTAGTARRFINRQCVFGTVNGCCGTTAETNGRRA